MNKQTGFTLIELIMVIVILGILAATALPKFSDLSAEARVAKINAMKGSMQSAATMAHGLQLARGAASDVSVSVEGGNLVTMANGYPTADSAGIGAAVDLTSYDSTGLAASGIVATDANHLDCKITYVNANPPTYTINAAPADCK